MSHWHDVIDDLSVDEIRLGPLQPWRVRSSHCEACSQRLTLLSYAVDVELPFGIEGCDDERWHYFGDLCWECTLTVVANGGHPTPIRSRRDLTDAEIRERLDRWIRETYGDKNG